MYQIKLFDNSPNNWIYASFFADVDDKIAGSITYVGQIISSPYFLLEYKSQLTGKIKRFNPYTVYGYVGGTNTTGRFVYFLSKVSLTQADDVANGLIKVGTTDMPYGFYDFKIYEMNTKTMSERPTGFQSLTNLGQGQQ